MGSGYDVDYSSELRQWTALTNIINEAGLAPFFDPGAAEDLLGTTARLPAPSVPADLDR